MCDAINEILKNVIKHKSNVNDHGEKTKPNLGLIALLTLWAVWILRSGYWLWLEIANPLMTAKRIGLGFCFVLLTSFGGLILYTLFQKVKQPTLALAFILGGTFLIRLAYITLIPTRPQSDFLVYHSMAIQFVQGDYQNSYDRPMGYPLLLSIFYRWLPDALAGRLLNVFLSTLIVLLGYFLGKRIHSSSLGLISAYLLAVYPAEIMMTSVLATETAASLCITAAFLSFLSNQTKNGSKLAVVFMGFSLSIGFILRTAYLIYFPLFLLLIAWQERKVLKTMWSKLSCTLLSFVIPIALFLTYCATLLGGFSFKPLSSSVSYFPFLAGTGKIVNNSFAKDSKIYSSWPENKRAILSFNTAWDRIRSNPLKAIRVAIEKIDSMFGSDRYALMWSFDSVKTRLSKVQLLTLRMGFTVWAQLTKLALLLFGGVGLIYFWKTNRMVLWAIVSLILVTLLPHLILEAQGRYRHQLNPTMALLAAGGLMYVREVVRAKRITSNPF